MKQRNRPGQGNARYNARSDASQAKAEQLHAALTYCCEQGCGAVKALKDNKWPLLSKAALGRSLCKLRQEQVHGQVDLHKFAVTACTASNRILTAEEEDYLVQYCVACHDQNVACTKQDLERVTLKLLQLRRGLRSKFRGSRKYVALSRAATQALQKGRLSDEFFDRFYALHRDALKRVVPVQAEAERVRQATEENIHEHFYAPHGLVSELLACSILDPETLTIADPSRLINIDELPQFVDYHTETGGGKVLRYASRTGKKTATVATAANRESITVHMTIGLDGFLYGLVILLARSQFTASMIPDEMEVFTEKIDEEAKFSTYGMVALTERGMQTGQTLLESMRQLDSELSARGVKRPVVIMSDQHASRFDADVLEFCAEHSMRLWLEKPQTSNLFQELEQIEGQFHTRYRREAKQAKEAIARGQKNSTGAKVQGCTINLGLHDFLEVMTSVWPRWSTPIARKLAWRAAGITASGLLNRTTFRLHEQPQICSDEPQTPEPQHQYEKEQYNATPSPIDPTRREEEYYREKALAWQRAHQARPRVPLREMMPFDIPDGNIHVPKRRCLRLDTDKSESATMKSQQGTHAKQKTN
eukprot:scaffold3586_cov404-Prasinococcus_capsulatus_cf.AAC.26